MLFSGGQIVLDPIENGPENGFFAGNVEIVVAKQRYHVIRGQKHEFLITHHLHYVFGRVFIRRAPEFRHTLSIGKGSNSEAVGRMQLLLKEVRADLHDVS